MSGNNVMGNENNDINPNNRSKIDTTVDKTGLSINLLIMPVGFVVKIVNRQLESSFCSLLDIWPHPLILLRLEKDGAA